MHQTAKGIRTHADLVAKFLAFFASAPYSVTFKRLDNSVKPEPVTRHIMGLFEFFSKKATFKLSLMANDKNKFLPIFQILDIKNVSFLLKLEMALAISIRMKFEPVCFGLFVISLLKVKNLPHF